MAFRSSGLVNPRALLDGPTNAIAEVPLGDLHAEPVDGSTQRRKAEVSFVDTAVADWESLVTGIQSARPDIDIELLDTARSGVEQIKAWASVHRGYDAIHILSHGAEGQLCFGSETVGSPAALAVVGQALKPGGDVLLYGCNLAKGAEGQRFIADLASLTGATVAASTDSTGAFALGGNWHLAARTGALNTAALRIDDYAGLLNLDSVMTSPSLTLTLDRPGVDPDNSHYTAQSVVGLPGGGSAVSWLDPTGSSHTGFIEFLSPTGNVVSTVSLTAAVFTELSSGGSELTALSNGDVAFTYEGVNGTGYLSIIGSGGVAVNPVAVAFAGNSMGQPTQLSNGDIAVPSVVGTTLHIDFYSTQAGSLGNAVGTEVQIANAQLISAPSSNNVVGNDSGSFAVIYNSTSDAQTHLALYANAGTSPAATISFGDNALLAQAVALSNGDFAVLTSDENYANFKVQIYSASGSTVGNAVSLSGISGDIFISADLTPGQQGFNVFSDNSDDGNVYAVRFDNAGNIVAGGTQSSQGNITSFENSGNGVEVYHGADFLSDAAGSHSAGAVNLYLDQSISAPVLQIFELAGPTVSSITAIGSSPNHANSEQFTVTFSESVSGVVASDFTLTTANTPGGAAFATTGISSITGSGTTYIVTVGGVTGDGTLRLDLNANSTGITGASGIGATAAFTSGDVYTIEHTPPAVTSVGVPANASFIAGQNLDFVAHFSEAATVTGTPEIALTLDTGGIVDAQYVSGSGTSALTFRYAVVGGEADTDGVAVGSAILLNGGTVKDAATNAAVLTLNNVASTSGVLVDSIPPTVTSLAVPADGIYGTGQSLTFTANFSENVLVTTGGGTPYIDVALDTGGTVHAVYTGGSGTNQLTFSYTVASGNDDTNGVAVGSSIVLNGGTIKDTATNAAVLSLNSVPSTNAVLVDAIPPTVTSINTVDGSPNNLNTEHFTVTFSAPVNGVDASDFTVVGAGTASGAVTSVTGSGAIWTVTVGSVSGDGTLRLDLNNSGDPITDNFGNTLTAAHTGDQSYTVQHTAPAVTSVTVPADGTYAAAQDLDFTTTFSEAVFVTGTPRISLTLDDGGTVYATYVSGSGTNTLTFRDIVAVGQQDLTGITNLPVIDLNGGAIKDATGNAASGAGLNLTGEPSTAGVDVDAIVPAVSSVSVPSNGTYGIAQDLDFTVHLTKTVTVNAGGGTPYIDVTLDTGGTVHASYLSGTGTSDLVFRYVIPGGELDTNGVTVGANLVLDGGTIQDSRSNDAATALLNVASTTGVLVDSIPPGVTSIHTVESSTNNLNTEHFTVTFSTDVSLNPPDTTDFALHPGSVAGTIASVTAVSGSTYTVTVTGVSGDGTLGLDFTTSGSTVTDAFGNPVTSAHTGDQSYTIDHTAPSVLSVAADHTALLAGQTVVVTFTFSEAIQPFALADTHVTGGALSDFVHVGLNAGHDVYTAIFTPDASNTEVGSVQVTASSYSDVASNPGSASSIVNFRGDTLAPHLTGITASPGSGNVFAGSTVALTVGFNEAVDVTGGTPTLTLNDGASAVYDAGATALLGDSSKLVFDDLVSANDPFTPSLAVTGLVAHGATVNDLAGNHADLSNVTAAFALMVNGSSVPAYTFGGLTRPALELDASGHIILDDAASNFASTYGTKALYAGLPPSTPYPPVVETHSDFHLI